MRVSTLLEILDVGYAIGNVLGQLVVSTLLEILAGNLEVVNLFARDIIVSTLLEILGLVCLVVVGF